MRSLCLILIQYCVSRIRDLFQLFNVVVFGIWMNRETLPRKIFKISMSCRVRQKVSKLKKNNATKNTYKLNFDLGTSTPLNCQYYSENQVLSLFMSSDIPKNTLMENESLDKATNPVTTLQLETNEYGDHSAFFPAALHDIISDESNSDIITWLPTGKAFLIMDKKRFAQEIIPRHFPQMVKFTSFTRKLARWGFQRIPRGPFIGSYYHASFIKGDRDKCFKINYYNKSEETQNNTGRSHFRIAPTLEGNLPMDPPTGENDHWFSTVPHTHLSQTMETVHQMPNLPFYAGNAPHHATVPIQSHVSAESLPSRLSYLPMQGIESNNRYMQPTNASPSFSFHNIPQNAQISQLLWNNIRNSPTGTQLAPQMTSDSNLAAYLQLQLHLEQLKQYELRHQLLHHLNHFQNQVQDLNLPRQQEQKKTPNNRNEDEDLDCK